MARIFISYKRLDRDKVFPIKDRIEKALGEKCWIDLTGIESDAQFMNVIIHAINEAEVMLFMYSRRHSLITDFENDWTMRELNFAQRKGKRIVFINLDGTPLTDQFDFVFGTKQQIEARSAEAMQRLIHDLRTWLNITEKRIAPNDVPKKDTGKAETPKEKTPKAVGTTKEATPTPQVATKPQPSKQPQPTTPHQSHRATTTSHMEQKKAAEAEMVKDNLVNGTIHSTLFGLSLLLYGLYAYWYYDGTTPSFWTFALGASLALSFFASLKVCRNRKEATFADFYVYLPNLISATALVNISAAFVSRPIANGNFIPFLHRWLAGIGDLFSSHFWLWYILMLVLVTALQFGFYLLICIICAFVPTKQQERDSKQ